MKKIKNIKNIEIIEISNEEDYWSDVNSMCKLLEPILDSMNKFIGIEAMIHLLVAHCPYFKKDFLGHISETWDEYHDEESSKKFY